MSRNDVKPCLTRKRPGAVENDEYGAFCRRVLRAYARRVATGDVEGLAQVVALGVELDRSTQDAVDGLRTFGYSWADIAARLRVTRQAAWQRWGGASSAGGTVNGGGLR